MKLNFFFLMITIFSLVGCDDSEEGLKEATQVQTKEQINAQNENVKEWAKKLESDLVQRRSFINAVEGDYEGEFMVNTSKFKIRLKIVPTIPDYDVNRDRTVAELEYELQNLNLNIQALQWNPQSTLSAVGCTLEDIKPDLKKGVLNLISESCKNSYQLFLSEGESNLSISEESRLLAVDILKGKLGKIPHLKGELQSISNANIFKFTLARIEE